MPSTPPLDRPGRQAASRILAGAAIAVLVAACGGHASRHSGSTSTTLLTSDRWSPPAAPAGPGAQAFCSVVVPVYRHMADIPHAASTRVKAAIVSDYLAEVPVMIGAAPGELSADARRYFNGVGEILADLERAGLDPHKMSDPNLRNVLLDPNVKSAGDQVISFVKSNCGYTIGG